MQPAYRLYNGQKVAYSLVHHRRWDDVWQVYAIVWNPAAPDKGSKVFTDSDLFAITEPYEGAQARQDRTPVTPAPRWARDLHVRMGRLRVDDHAAFASEAAGRRVEHLRDLTAAERLRVDRALLHLEASQYLPA